MRDLSLQNWPMTEWCVTDESCHDDDDDDCPDDDDSPDDTGHDDHEAGCRRQRGWERRATARSRESRDNLSPSQGTSRLPSSSQLSPQSAPLRVRYTRVDFVHRWQSTAKTSARGR